MGKGDSWPTVKRVEDGRGFRFLRYPLLGADQVFVSERELFRDPQSMLRRVGNSL